MYAYVYETERRFCGGCVLSIVAHDFVQTPITRPRLRSPDVSECRRHPVRTSKLGATAMGRLQRLPLKVQQISSVRCRPPAAIVQPSSDFIRPFCFLVYTTLGSGIEQWHSKRLHKLPFCPAPVNTCVPILARPVGRAQQLHVGRRHLAVDVPILARPTGRAQQETVWPHPSVSSGSNPRPTRGPRTALPWTVL
jgi:hypothetical protein